MNSLKIKFLGLCGVILIVAIGLTTWYNLQTQKAMLSKLATEHGRLLAETIRNSIITDMANGKNDQRRTDPRQNQQRTSHQQRARSLMNRDAS